MKTLALVIIAIVVAGSVGTSYALITHADNVAVNGNLTVNDGNIVSVRTDGSDSGNAMKNNGGSMVFTFSDLDDSQVYRFKLLGTGQEFQFLDFTHGNRLDLVIKTATGNIGIGEPNPQERLDVGGNLHVRDGTITADGDICIGACP